MGTILQSQIPFDYTTPRPLPGISPLDPADWLIVDDAFKGQMQERARLIAAHRDDVIKMAPTARAACGELLTTVLGFLSHHPGYDVGTSCVRRPDGANISIDVDDPLGVLSGLVQNDFCILQKDHGDEHILSAASLCFPASWSLAEKFMRPLVAIHEPVESYDDNIAKRVQRLFDGIQVGRPLWRFNMLRYAVATLHHPRTLKTRRSAEEQNSKAFIRVERQTLLRLPETRAIVFGIHTFVIRG